MFGNTESVAARKALKDLRKYRCNKILELGAGQGRDTLYFARNHLSVEALDYSDRALSEIREKASQSGLSDSIHTRSHDIRESLPYHDHSFDAVYSHMLFCMALTTRELQFLSNEIRRILKPGGINIYTVRNVEDPHFGKGIPRGEKMYEISGFIVHFFDKEKVNFLSKGYEIVDINHLEEGSLPKKLDYVVVRRV